MEIVGLCCLPRLWRNLLVVVALAIAGAMVFSGRAFADTYTLRDEAGSVVRLLEEPCEGPPAWLGLRKATVLYHGKDYDACWVGVGQVVVVFDSNGDATPIPAAQFTKDLSG